MSNKSTEPLGLIAGDFPDYTDIQLTVISKANSRQFSIFLPTFVVICGLMIIGIPGNVLALLVYVKRLKNATARQFLMTLAACDLLTCSVVMPIELAIMTHFFDWDLRWLCKSFRLFSYSVSNISSLTLLCIAVERYRLICKPWKQKFTNETSRYICYGNVIIAVLYAFPMFFIYGTQTIPLHTTENTHLGNLTNSSMDITHVIYGKSCLMDDHNIVLPSAVHFSVITTCVYISSIVVMFLVLIFLYGHVIKTLANRRKESLCQKEKKSKLTSATRIRKITIMMIVLTVLYEICYLPCLSVVCLRLTQPELYNTLSKAGKTTFQLLLKSYLLCSAFNPFVYCFCNQEFLAGLFWIIGHLLPQIRRRQSILQSGKLVTVSKSKELQENSMSKAKTMETEDLL